MLVSHVPFLYKELFQTWQPADNTLDPFTTLAELP